MAAIRLTHAALHADDLDASVRFYGEIFGMSPIATPVFGFPVQWLELGNQQLHLFVRESAGPPVFHHVGIDVDDFADVYGRAAARGIHDRKVFFTDIYELPDGSLQTYVRDPGGNLIEVNAARLEASERALLPAITKLADVVEQTPEALHAGLYTNHLTSAGGLRVAEVGSPRADGSRMHPLHWKESE